MCAKVCLFDVESDPGEARDLSHNPSMAVPLKQMIDRFWTLMAGENAAPGATAPNLGMGLRKECPARRKSGHVGPAEGGYQTRMPSHQLDKNFLSAPAHVPDSGVRK
eukprot:CAMPEP_0119509450 /NCGR_PEP_ID=MMETSP1344-20130328/28737_1 /TAXON_ID=236787 /ORGANISM="Florenciella parvula, Strain CCMP2471" /LENGTH=106 /DNA_ID=CAMNT_0007546279 /DNA_START=63 /DNA_END=380 /DNA_ORIENTATION=-